MVLPRHVPWANPEPAYLGKYDFEFPETAVTIESAGYTDVEVGAGNVNLIYKLLAASAGSLEFSFAIYDHSDLGTDDICFQKTAITSDYNSVTEGDGLIVQVDRAGESIIYLRVYGTVGDVITFSGNMVRLR